MKWNLVISFAVMQVAWFAAVVGAARGHGWIGPLVVIATLVFHVRQQPYRSREVRVLLLAAIGGLAVDTALIRAGVIAIPGATFSPTWLVALWPNLAAATASSGSLRSLERRPVLGALLGAVAGPLAYDGGRRLGALDLGGEHPLRSLLVIGVVWAGVLPALFWLRHQKQEESCALESL